MKTKAKQKSKTREYIISKTADERILSLLLSPLEAAAYEADYKPFKFKIEEIDFDITEELCTELMQLHFQRMKGFHQFIDKLIKTKLYSNPKYAKFLFLPLRELKLSTRVYHRLHGYGCENLSQVLKLGNRGILRIRGIGPRSINEIKALLKRNDCEILLD